MTGEMKCVLCWVWRSLMLRYSWQVKAFHSFSVVPNIHCSCFWPSCAKLFIIDCSLLEIEEINTSWIITKRISRASILVLKGNGLNALSKKIRRHYRSATWFYPNSVDTTNMINGDSSKMGSITSILVFVYITILWITWNWNYFVLKFRFVTLV